jgi:hypothetical protein
MLNRAVCCGCLGPRAGSGHGTDTLGLGFEICVVSGIGAGF